MSTKKSRGPLLTKNMSATRASFSKSSHISTVLIDFGSIWLYLFASFRGTRLSITNFTRSTNIQRCLDEFQEKETSQHVSEKVSSLALVTKSAGIPARLREGKFFSFSDEKSWQSRGRPMAQTLIFPLLFWLTTYAIIFSNRQIEDIKPLMY